MYKILFIDDDAYSMQNYVNEFEFNKYTITQCKSPKNALKKLELTYFDIVILDMWMDYTGAFSKIETEGGWKSGLVLSKYIRQTYENTYVIALTSSIDPEIIEWFKSNEMVHYCNKRDTDPKKLKRIIEKVCKNEELDNVTESLCESNEEKVKYYIENNNINNQAVIEILNQLKIKSDVIDIKLDKMCEIINEIKDLENNRNKKKAIDTIKDHLGNISDSMAYDILLLIFRMVIGKSLF